METANDNETNSKDLKLDLKQNSHTKTAADTITSKASVASFVTSPNIVQIPVPVVPPEDICYYIAVKGSLHAQESSVFGLNREEISALLQRFPSSTEIMNGVMVKTSPINLINLLSKLGYKVICTTGETEIVWTLQREL